MIKDVKQMHTLTKKSNVLFFIHLFAFFLFSFATHSVLFFIIENKTFLLVFYLLGLFIRQREFPINISVKNTVSSRKTERTSDILEVTIYKKRGKSYRIKN